MNTTSSLGAFIRQQIARIVALALIVTLYGLARLPQPTTEERTTLASSFSFVRTPLPELPGHPFKTERAVHASMQRISSWISSVGAAIALNDIDGDGLPNDLCYVDPRTDLVILTPVPGTPQRYQPFSLLPAPLPYDTATMAPMGSIPADINEDGRMDLLVYYWGRTPVAFLQRESHINGQGLSAQDFVPCEVASRVERWYTNAATFADLDGDGHADLIIGNYFPDGARVLDATASGTEQMQHSMSRAFNAGRNRLLRWNGGTTGTVPSVTFADATDALDSIVAHGWTLAVGAADLDGDLLPEIYFANDFGPDRLLYNLSKPGQIRFALLEGKRTLTMPSSRVVGRDSFKGMGIDFGDLNGDGLLDIYVSNITSEYSLEESHFAFLGTGQFAQMRDGFAPFVDHSEELGLSRSGWGWDTRLGDFNNDGQLEALQATGFVRGEVNRWPELQELATGNDDLLMNLQCWPRFKEGDDLSGHQHNPFFARAGDGRFYDIAAELGLDQPEVTRGIATADVDGDGRLDYGIANQWDISYFYHNRAPHPGSFLGLHLRLPVGADDPLPIDTYSGHPTTPSRPAIGASATVVLPDGKHLVAQVDGGNGHSGKRSPDLHFGLGHLPADTPVTVNIDWRDWHGKPHHDTLRLPAGWHTVMLGGKGTERRREL